MKPSDINSALQLLSDAGYLCVHVEPQAEWTVDTISDLSGPGIGIAVQLTPEERARAERRMLRIKRLHGIEC